MTYNEFIQNIIDTRGQWNIPDGEYFERHHIIPRCMGGEPKKILKCNEHHENIIWLYPEEHYIAHKLLFIENKNNKHLAAAYLMMAFPKSENLKRDFEIGELEYKILREEAARLVGKSNKGLKRTDEQKDKLKGRTPWNKGLTKDDDRVKELAINLSKSLKESGARSGAKNSQFGNTGRITGDKNPMRSKSAREKVSNNMKLNNPMRDPEVAKRVHDKTRGRVWYHSIDNLNRGQFFEGEQPEDWIRGMKTSK